MMALKIKWRESDSVIWRQRKFAELKKKHPGYTPGQIRSMVTQEWAKESARRKKAGGMKTPKAATPKAATHKTAGFRNEYKASIRA